VSGARQVLVTGASGFLGRAVVTGVLARGDAVRATTRSPVQAWPPGVQALPNLDLAPGTDWSAALGGVDFVVHCAARVHVMHDTAPDPLAEFRRVNTAATLALARQAVAAGVRRFVFISSIGVNGAETTAEPFRADDTAAPRSPYAVSKHEAEEGLRALAGTGGMQVVAIRPPLVYGPGAPGNFAQLMRALRRGLPLPLGSVHNRRSFIALDNLVDLVLVCLDHPAAANQTFLAGDGEDVSTTQLLQRLGCALGHPAWLVPLPAPVLRSLFGLLGKADISQRLFSSLQVDISATRDRLGWQPPISLDEGLRRAAVAFLAETAR
jgi:UDP-4-keto-D-QuiNAc 4-reductase